MIVAMLLGGLLQGAAIVAVTYAVTRCVSERNAGTRYALWFVALLALVAMPVLTVVSNVGARIVDALRPSAGMHGVTISLLPVGTLAQEAGAVTASVTTWIVAAWLIGVTFALARLATSFVRIERIRRNAVPFIVGRESVLVSADITIPIAAGLVSPVVVIPKAIFETLAPVDLERIIAHERAHIRRNDIAGNLIQRTIEAVLFFNPWVYAIGRNLVNERESACDDLAVQRTGEADEYAATLASLAQTVVNRRAPLLTPSALGSSHAVLGRIDRLLRNGASRATSLNYYSIAGTIAIFAILTLALQACVTKPTGASVAQPTQLTQPSTAKTVAASGACTVPNAEASVVSPAPPNYPDSARGLAGTHVAKIIVTILPSGELSGASVVSSSGSKAIDAAAMTAAEASTYSPARINCKPVTGKYIFRAEFNPD